MSQQPKIEIDSNHLTAHWFSRHFYKKDGRKSVLETRKLKWVGLVTFVVGYGSFLFQTDMPSEAGVVSVFKLSAVGGIEDREKHPVADQSVEKEETKYDSRRRTTKARQYSGPELIARPRVPLPSGIAVRARLLTGATNGPVRAELIEPIIVSGSVLQEPGATLVGTGSSSDDRLQIRFNRMVYPDGEAQAINAEALDPDDRTAGLRGSMLGNRATKAAGSIGLSFTAGMAEGLQETEIRNGTTLRSPSIKNSLLNGVSTTAIEQSHELLSDLRNSRPVIQVNAGKEFLVIFIGE